MPTTEPLILIIEDDEQMRSFLRALLSGHSYRLVEATSGAEGITQAAMHNPDVVLLDLGLPDMDGLTVCERLREWTQIPIIVLSARGMEQDKIEALDLGADDYLTKPFGAGELLARLRVALRHMAQIGGDDGDPQFALGDLHVDMASRRVTVDGADVHLTPIEYKLLCTLVRHAGKVLTHRQILKEVWGPPYTSQTHYVRVYMAQLRRKIEVDPSEPLYIITETGIGYRLRDELPQDVEISRDDETVES